jgi:hypothetical protein
MIYFEITREEWTARRPAFPSAPIAGVDRCRRMFGTSIDSAP